MPYHCLSSPDIFMFKQEDSHVTYAFACSIYLSDITPERDNNVILNWYKPMDIKMNLLKK